MIWLLVFLLLLLPLGISLRYQETGVHLYLKIAGLSLKLYPLPKKEGRQKQKQQSEAPKQAAPATASEKAKKTGGSLRDFQPLLSLGLRFLQDFHHRLRVDLLQVRLTLAGDDPCDLALSYGRSWAAVGALLPQLERMFRIRQRDIQLSCDFTAAQSSIFLRADLSLCLGRLLQLGLYYGYHGLRAYLNLKKKKAVKQHE